MKAAGETLQVLYEDNHLIAVNKRPADIVQGDKTGDQPLSEKVKEYLKNKYAKTGSVFVGVPHRLDRPTSGVVLFARTSKALERLALLFREGGVAKKYWAMVQARPPRDEDTLVHYLTRNSEQNKSYLADQPRPGAQEARLRYRLLLSLDRYHLLEVEMQTGRHHQIRAQLARIGCPIKGDLKYGARRSNPGGGIHLHAREVSFVHPVRQVPVRITADPPPDPLWDEALRRLAGGGQAGGGRRQRATLLPGTDGRRPLPTFLVPGAAARVYWYPVMERTFHFLLNTEASQATLPSGLAVLDLLRRERRLTGTREGCREGDCGACLVLLGETGGGGVRYRPVNSCLLPLGELEGRHLVTIEGLNPTAGPGAAPALNPIQSAFVEEGATQCGFCTPGFMVALTGYFLGNENPDPQTAQDAVAGNLCRCTGYASIRRAIGRLLEQHRALPAGPALERCIGWGIVPAWLAQSPARLAALPGRKAERPRGAADQPETRTRAGGRAAPLGPAAAGVHAGVRAGEYPGVQPVLVAGGTDLFVQRPEELQDAPLVFLSERDLARTWVRDGRRFLGATLPMEELCGVPPFADCLSCVASGPVRQRATVGGNLVNASPIGDLTIMLLALGATLGIRKPAGRPALRELPLRDFYLGYKKLDLAEGEVVEWVAFPEPGDSGFHFEKVGRRQHLDIASVNTAALLLIEGGRIREARLAAGGVAPVPLLLRRTSEYLTGRDAGLEALGPRELARVLALAQEEIAPISDVRGSADYKRRLLKHLLVAVFLRLLPRVCPSETALALIGGGAAGGGEP